MQKQSLHCAACRTIAPDGSRFCPQCGRPLLKTDARVAASDTDMTVAADVENSDDRHVWPHPSTPLQIEPGAVIGGRYRVIRLLGRGGMGEVYLADDLRLSQEVALKFLPPALAGDAKRMAQFHDEVRLARQVSHPNVCRVYDIGEMDGHLFLSMEYVDGEDLAARLRRAGRFTESDAVELTRQLCAGLAAVHARGVLHRDLKPANILLDAASGRARLMDFGLATAGDVQNIREGTPAYMAPEQLLGHEVTARSDIYALGLVMHELFTGRQPFDAATVQELVEQRTTGRIRSNRDAEVTLPPTIERVILQCLERDPAKRPASAHAVSAMLQTVLLETTTRFRRIAQVTPLFVSSPLIAGGLMAMFRGQGTARAIAVGMIVSGLLLFVAALRLVLTWDVSYKGHRIRFQNHPIFGERLYIDDVLADSGRVGRRVTLRATIESGAGAGDRITAQSTAGLFVFSCRVIGESFSAPDYGPAHIRHD